MNTLKFNPNLTPSGFPEGNILDQKFTEIQIKAISVVLLLFLKNFERASFPKFKFKEDV
jgi:hypothetical protein